MCVWQFLFILFLHHPLRLFAFFAFHTPEWQLKIKDYWNTGNSSLKLSISEPKLSIYWNLHWFSNWQTAFGAQSSWERPEWCLFPWRAILTMQIHSIPCRNFKSQWNSMRLQKKRQSFVPPNVTSTELTSSWLQRAIFTRILSHVFLPIIFSLHSTCLDKKIIEKSQPLVRS